ncbi:MAG TPA: GNAT family N-acetyltransferase [Ktedonobacteraceae bacterium]|nr:GNAT family N-acetyltransferase [Ktedonobacteraceae bacterium]
MNKQAFTFEIKPAEASQLEVLEHEFSPHSLSKYHYQRYEVQKRGEGVYLIAWHDHTPVGHFLLRWSGPQDEHIMKHRDVTKTAYLSGGVTRMDFRRKGVATALIREAERLAKEHGCTHVGLDVGNTDNPDAKRLYEHLGYVDWGHGAFLISWEYIDGDGKTETKSQIVTYMYKPL